MEHLLGTHRADDTVCGRHAVLGRVLRKHVLLGLMGLLVLDGEALLLGAGRGGCRHESLGRARGGGWTQGRHHAILWVGERDGLLAELRGLGGVCRSVKGQFLRNTHGGLDPHVLLVL